MSGMERLTTSYNASRGLCAAFNGETDCDLRPGHLEQGIPHRLRSPSDGRWQAYDDDGHVVAQGGGTRYALGAKWAQTWDEYLASLLGFTSVAEQNLATFKHEAETPMRGHDPDAACCRAAVDEGATQGRSQRSMPPMNTNTLTIGPVEPRRCTGRHCAHDAACLTRPFPAPVPVPWSRGLNYCVCPPVWHSITPPPPCPVHGQHQYVVNCNTGVAYANVTPAAASGRAL